MRLKSAAINVIKKSSKMLFELSLRHIAGLAMMLRVRVRFAPG